MKRLNLVMFLSTISFIEICGAFDETLTVNIAPGARECFSQDISANSHYEIEYQVRQLYKFLTVLL